MTTRGMLRWLAAGAAASALLLLGGCAPSPPDEAWLLAPIRYDNAMAGGPAGQFTELPYPMRLAGDTAGGVWGESAGSWLHLDAEGTTLSRFNLDPGTSPDVTAFAAVTPSTLLVTATGIPSGTAASGVLLFDTAAMSWQTLRAESEPLGDVAVRDDSAYYVRSTAGAPSVSVVRFPLDAPTDAVVVSPEIAVTSEATPAAGVALAVGPDGTLYLATTTERIVVSPTGEIVERVAAASASPRVAVSPAGELLWSGGPEAPDAAPAIVGGAGDTRAALELLLDCADGERLAVGPAATARSVPSPCPVQGVAWLDDAAFLVSAGGEGGAPLVRMTPPRIEG